jgi:hypothetical protein
MIASIGTLSIMVRLIVAMQAGRRDDDAEAWKVVQHQFEGDRLHKLRAIER